MNRQTENKKEVLISIINQMSEYQWLFVKNPEKDFTRNRKLDFKTLMTLLLSMNGNSIYKELLDCCSYTPDIATSSAFVQQRDKILPIAFEFLLHEFNKSVEYYKTYKGYRLLAVDGSTLSISHNPNDSSTYSKPKTAAKGFNQLHLNAMYDLCNKVYIDATIQTRKEKNEYHALTDMVDRSALDKDTILIADRGYESYNVLAHIHEKGWKYVIRIKDIESNGMAASFNLPRETFDRNVNRILTRKLTKEVTSHPEVYKFITGKSPFDYLDADQISYPMSFRLVRFKITEDKYETVITNLDKEVFSPNEIKKLYHMRWGIETSFRELKYALGLNSFHAKKVEYITQEVFARLVMYNFSFIITMNVIIDQKDTKHVYQINFTVAIQICKHFLRHNIPPSYVEVLIRKNILPVRENRKNLRKPKIKSFTSFLYRIA
jgi:hypothetical protein